MFKQTITNYIDTQLNDAQKKAVLHTMGALQVVAGAGSGKTRVITSRIAHMILNQLVLPRSIIALTFTNKAAKEMKKRIESFLDSKYDLPFVGTFHAFCVQLLKQNQSLLSTPFFSILDSDDQEKMIKGILQRANIHKQYSPKTIAYTISQMKNSCIDPDNPNLALLGHPIIQDVYRAYEQEKSASKCYDFDDIILETISLFKKNNTFKKNFHTRIRHILIDEYQDTNIMQHELLKQMSLFNDTLTIDSVCVVGDEDQSIYSWRGATVENMLHFKNDFSNVTLIKIEQNYRSAKPILSIANALIAHNTQRTPKILRATKTATSIPLGLQLISSYQEASVISHLIKYIKQKKKNASIALLYRTHSQSRSLEEALIKDSIAYKIIGGIQFYERKEIKDLLAYLKLIINPFDRTSFFRIFNTPSRGLGTKCEEKIYAVWKDQPFLTFHDIVEKVIHNDLIKGNKKVHLEQFLFIFNDITPTTSTCEALKKIITKTNYLQYIKNKYEVDAQTRIENIQELENAMKYFASQNKDTVEAFLYEVALLQDKLAHQKESSNAVLLMTLHAAKGLEFDTVILPGLEDGILPTQRSTHDHSFVEEERRLFYVGITRAREHIVLTYTKNRYAYGQMTNQIPSRFLSEIPNNLITFRDCSYWNTVQYSNLFSQWLNNAIDPSLNEQSKPSIPQKLSNQKEKKTFTFGLNNKKVWKINQPVKHKKYGIGIVIKVEKKDTCNTHLTISFNGQKKKILSKFVEQI